MYYEALVRSTKMRRKGRLEMPADSFLFQHLSYSGIGVQRIDGLAKLSFGADEVCAVVGVHGLWPAIDTDKAPVHEKKISSGH